MRKKITVAIFCVIIFCPYSQAQDWYEMLMGDNPNLYEVKQAYETYWNDKEFVKDGKTQYYKRWLEKMDLFADADGYFAQPNWTKADDQKYLSRKTQSITNGRTGPNSSWYEIGPWAWDKNAAGLGYAPGITRMNTVEQDPSDSNAIYVGTAQAGLWQSLNGGNGWTCLTSDMMVKAVSSIEINHSNSNVIYFGAETGVYKSIDRGTTWSITGISQSYYSGFILQLAMGFIKQQMAVIRGL